jgi:hypothetical protein
VFQIVPDNDGDDENFAALGDSVEEEFIEEGEDNENEDEEFD